MAKFKVTFSKSRKGQTSFERSFSLEGLELLFCLCQDFSIISRKRKSAVIIFSFPDGAFKKAITAKNIPLWIAKKFAPEKEWK